MIAGMTIGIALVTAGLFFGQQGMINSGALILIGLAHYKIDTKEN